MFKFYKLNHAKKSGVIQILEYYYILNWKIKGDKMKNSVKNRDGNVLMAMRREISLSTRTTRDKTKYSRKEKHKLKLYA